MASVTKCSFCGNEVRPDERICPHCGGANENYVPGCSHSFSLPGTIEELIDYCAEKQIPLNHLRFFIGEDYRFPKAYGIFKYGENRYVVYKNKTDGSRSVRYDGPDEAYAVSELFAKLLEECQKAGILNIRK